MALCAVMTLALAVVALLVPRGAFFPRVSLPATATAFLTGLCVVTTCDGSAFSSLALLSSDALLRPASALPVYGVDVCVCSFYCHIGAFAAALVQLLSEESPFFPIPELA